MEELSKKEIALNNSGATREAAYRAYADALSATTIKYDRDGESMGAHPDYQTRIKAADSISRLNGDMKADGSVTVQTINISVGKEEIKALLNMASDVREQLSQLKVSGKQTGEVIDVQARLAIDESSS